MKVFNENRFVSILWMFSWAFFFSVSMALVKFLKTTPTTTIVFIRLLCSLALVTPFFIYPARPSLKTKLLPKHILNGALRCGGIWATYYAYSKLPMGFAASIGFTDPMMTVMLAMFLLGERVRRPRWIAIIVGYAGVLLMMRPEKAEAMVAIGVALLANLCASLGKIITKEITKTDSSLQIMVYSNTVSFILSALLVGFMWEVPSPQDWPILITIGICGTLSQFSYIQALQKGQVSMLAPFEYVRLLFAVLLGIIFFQEIPTPWDIVGGVLIIGASAFLMGREVFQARGISLKNSY